MEVNIYEPSDSKKRFVGLDSIGHESFFKTENFFKKIKKNIQQMELETLGGNMHMRRL